MKLKWLQEDKVPFESQEQNFVNLDAQMVFNDDAGNFAFHISRGLDILSIEYPRL